MVENGNYTLRASPVAGVGGKYATGNGTSKIVTVAAHVPPTSHRQNWTITALEGKKDIYTIVQFHLDDISLGGSWSLEDNLTVPHGPVITTHGHAEWHITPAHNNIHDAYYIQPVTKVVSRNKSWYVGTNDKNQVVIKSSPILLPPFPDRPYWELKKST